MAKLYYQEYGHGLPLVLLPGWAMHQDMFKVLSEQLKKHYRVIAIDLPGHGQSHSIDPYILDGVLAAILAVTPVEACYWVGWSLGGSLVLEIANRYPDRVNALCLLSCNPCFVAQGDWPGISESQITSLRQDLLEDTETALSRFLVLQFQGLINAKQDLYGFKESWFKHKAPDLNVLLSGLKILENMDLRSNLKQLQIPATMILGLEDRLVPYQVAEQIKQLNPLIRFKVIHGAGHASFFSHQSEVIETVADSFPYTRPS